MTSHGPTRKQPRQCVCAVCGAPFAAARYHTRQTCSDACRRALIAANRARQAPRPTVWHVVPCCICGRVMRMTGAQYHTGGRSTCSRACGSALRARNGGAVMAAHGDTIDAARRVGHQASPRTRRDSPDHNAAIEWRLIAPDGQRHDVRNLSALIRQYYGADIAQRDLLRWQSGIGRLRPERTGRRRQYKGWRWGG